MDKLIVDIGLLSEQNEPVENVKVLPDESTGKSRKLYIESYGCQMNFSDSEIVASILRKEGFDTTSDINQADLVFLNTCSIREKAEQNGKEQARADQLDQKAKARNDGRHPGMHGRKAETRLLEEEKIVDLVAGPDAYRDLPD